MTRKFKVDFCIFTPGSVSRVESLSIQHPDEQRVVFSTANAEKAPEAAINTKLTGYFAKTIQDPDARNKPYCDFPKHYTWHSVSKVWTNE